MQPADGQMPRFSNAACSFHSTALGCSPENSYAWIPGSSACLRCVKGIPESCGVFGCTSGNPPSPGRLGCAVAASRTTTALLIEFVHATQVK